MKYQHTVEESEVVNPLGGIVTKTYTYKGFAALQNVNSHINAKTYVAMAEVDDIVEVWLLENPTNLSGLFQYYENHLGSRPPIHVMQMCLYRV